MSDSIHHSFLISLTLRAPFLLAGLEPQIYGVDTCQTRTRDGFAIIPGSHLKGVLRHSITLMFGQQRAEKLFGVSDDVLDGGGQITFLDLVSSARNFGKITRLEVDEETGAAREGHLVTVEAVAPAGAEIEFTGEGTILGISANEAKIMINDLQAAFDQVVSMGRYKSIGYGRLVSRQIGAPVPKVPKVGLWQIDDAEVEFSFSLDRPLMTDIQRPDNSTLHSSETITGAAIKATLARNLRAKFNGSIPEEIDAFVSRLVVGHASPDIENKATNLSQVEVEGQYALVSYGDVDLGIEQRFKPDFKKPTNKTTLDRIVRTRSAIDAERGASADGQLFTHSAVSHEFNDRPLVFTSRILRPTQDAATSSSHDAWKVCLDALKEGLFGIGKTKACTAEISLKSTAVTSDWASTNSVEISLQSSALMLRVRHLDTPMAYKNAFAAYWFAVSDGELNLAADPADPAEFDMFVSVSFRGDFASNKFGYFGREGREPWVLVDAGSVFRLEAKNCEAAAIQLKKFRDQGLPVAEWQDDGTLIVHELADYRECPFLPQNGYGAIELIKGISQ